jgi:hypothetical protein
MPRTYIQTTSKVLGFGMIEKVNFQNSSLSSGFTILRNFSYFKMMCQLLSKGNRFEMYTKLTPIKSPGITGAFLNESNIVLLNRNLFRAFSLGRLNLHEVHSR